jgi:uncharacterized membrane protein HdeD (DUF308 family)
MAAILRPHPRSMAKGPAPSGWFVKGVVLLFIGLGAVGYPVFAKVDATVLMGWTLVGCGIAGASNGFTAKDRLYRLWSRSSALAAITAGSITTFDQAASIRALPLLLIAWFALDGVCTLMMTIHLRQTGARSWNWLAALTVTDGLSAMALPLLAPGGDALIIGVVLGFDLILAGAVLMTAAILAEEPQ